MKKMSDWMSALGIFVATCQVAGASIIYSGEKGWTFDRSSYRTTNPGVYPDPSAFNFDLNGDGINDFSIFTYAFVPASDFVLFGARALGGSYYEGSSSSVLDSLDQNFSLGSGTQWISNQSGGHPLDPPAQNWWSENWYGFISGSANQEFFLGVILDIYGAKHYGWIGTERMVDESSDDLVIKDWAYESVANAPILTGDMGHAATPVPEPSTYGLIGAVGLVGLSALRRRAARMEK